ncbi:energy transducer TonB [Pectinatus haikarae]|uniref:Protein TonB n=1 Tax=Pectinatus haikarae TaxID=349096 RepID=A0ABT9Y8H0_9FIRM|nr:TonB family protein [Pectinatus haikarae]MDQ0204011.1 protein TonB [Pectinatus haikarae]
MQYPTHWRMAFLVAFLLHLGIWLAGSFILPHLQAEALPPEDTQALEWESVDEENDEPGPIEDEKQPEPSVHEERSPAPAAVPEQEKAEEQEVTPIVADEDEPATAELVKELADDPSKSDKVIIIDKKGSGGGSQSVQMGEPPILIDKFYPPVNIVTFRGRVSVFATIDVTGRIIRTKIAVTSGSPSVDQIAMDSARRWTFKPALDQNGAPMECTKIISIPFNMPAQK